MGVLGVMNFYIFQPTVSRDGEFSYLKRSAPCDLLLTSWHLIYVIVVKGDRIV